jgi:predicted TIM-barrel fold metal-dependent hydrolase
VRAGEVIRIRTTGGGGWGDPLERDPALVVRDVVWRKVSREAALATYGVVLTGADLDERVTAELLAVDAAWRRTHRSHYGFAMASDRLWGAAEDMSDLYAIARAPGGELRAFQRYVSYRRGLSLDAMRRLVPCAIHEVVRVETCAERLLGQTRTWDEFHAAFAAELRQAASRSVAFKSIIAYRSGLAVRRWTAGEAAEAYDVARRRVQRGELARLTDKPLLDTLFETTLDVCVETGRPLQVHAGFGDPDIDLLLANPLLLRPILEDPRRAGLTLVVLHMAHPYVREAAFMTAVWPQVHLDLSLALVFLGPAAAGPLVEILGLAPATKLLYGSDVGALPDLFVLAADWGRTALGEALDWLVGRRALSAERAAEAARLILSENAERLYGLRPA